MRSFNSSARSESSAFFLLSLDLVADASTRLPRFSAWASHSLTSSPFKLEFSTTLDSFSEPSHPASVAFSLSSETPRSSAIPNGELFVRLLFTPFFADQVSLPQCLPLHVYELQGLPRGSFAGGGSHQEQERSRDHLERWSFST